MARSPGRPQPAVSQQCLEELLPSEPEVDRIYGVSPQTARTAMQGLERDGLVVVRPRRGQIVRNAWQRIRWHLSEFERPDHTVLTTSDAWVSDVEGQGHDPTRQDLQVEQIPPPPIAQRLDLDPDHDVCVVRRHIRYIDDRLAIISDDFFDERIVRGTGLAGKSNGRRSRRAHRWPSTSRPATRAPARRCG